MNELIQRIQAFLNRPALPLSGREVSFFELITLIATLAVFVAVAGFLRRWLNRLFSKLRMPESTQNRLLALSFLIVMIVGFVVGLEVANISIGQLEALFAYEIPIGKDSSLAVAKLFYGCVIVFVVFILSKYAQWVLREQVLQAFSIDEHTQFILLRFFHIGVVAIGVLLSLNAIGLGLTNLTVILGGLSIGIGFGLQNIAANILSGIILIFERPIKIGDLVEIMDANIFGRVNAINLRSTVIVALDEKEIIVPNSQLVTEPVHNLTHYNRRFRVRVPVGVAYSSDVQLVKKALLEVAHAHPEVIQAPVRGQKNVAAPFVRFIHFGESSLDFELLAWIPDSFQRFDIASDLHFMIWEKFKENGISIPFPQRDVHFYGSAHSE